MNRYSPLKIALLGALVLTPARHAGAADSPGGGVGIPAGAPERQRKFCAAVLKWNEEYSRRVKALEGQHDYNRVNAMPSPDAASEQGLVELYALVAPGGVFTGWRGRPYIGVNGGSARIDLHACYVRDEIGGETLDVLLGGGGIPVDSSLAKSLRTLNTAKDVVVSGVFESRKWPNNLEQFLMMPRDIRHPQFAVKVTSVAQAK